MPSETVRIVAAHRRRWMREDNKWEQVPWAGFAYKRIARLVQFYGSTDETTHQLGLRLMDFLPDPPLPLP